jgi:hypothetical protein
MSVSSGNNSITQGSETVDFHRRTNNLTLVVWLLFVLAASGLLAWRMVAASPRPSYLAWLLFLAGISAILYQPRYGIYLILFLALLGDKGITPTYPFQLDFSSPESLLFLDQRMIFSPLEVYLVLTLASWLARDLILHRLQFYSGELFWPALIFMGFLVFGLAYGQARGGNLNVALWEARSIFYLPLMLILVSNLLTKRAHILILMSMVMAALFIEGLLGVSYYFTTLLANPGINPAEIMEHSAAIHMNTVFIFCLAVWLFRGPLKTRLLMLVLLLPILFTYLILQRRAAIVGLLFALICIVFMLYRENRKAFWIIIPAAALLLSVYLASYWDSSGRLGFPARAIKSQLFPAQASVRDQSSDNYRLIENYDIYYTIRQAPLTGVGFGQMFIMKIPLPDISFFVWYQYITHNSIGWIWMKTGIGGFVALLFLVGLAIMNGLRAVFRIQDGMMRAVVLTAVLYLLMHFTFAYVDMSWDSQSMVYMGAMMGIINCAEKVILNGAYPEQQLAPESAKDEFHIP